MWGNWAASRIFKIKYQDYVPYNNPLQRTLHAGHPPITITCWCGTVGCIGVIEEAVP